ncbi:MAG: YCF48-related protein [Planctomycetota bacterium]
MFCIHSQPQRIKSKAWVFCAAARLLCMAEMLCMGNAYSAQFVWETVPTGVEVSIRGLHAVDAKTIWACGSQGTVLKSVDGGESWSHHVLPDLNQVELRSIHGWNELEAIVATAGQPCKILRTADGGLSWKTVFQQPAESAFIDGMKFWNERSGFAVGDPIDGNWMILRSQDRGESWQIAPLEPVVAKRGEAAFAASNSSLIWLGPEVAMIGLGGNDGAAQILHTVDSGRTWTRRDVPGILRHESAGIFSLAADRTGRMVAVGGDYKKPELASRHIAISTDGGVSWSVPTGPAPRGFRSCVAYVEFKNSPLWITVGTNGAEWSHDGETWQPLSDDPFHALSVTSDGHAWASGSKGRIARLLAVP